MTATTTRTVKTACPYCGVGCGMQLTVRDGRVVKVSGDPAHPSNAGRLCTKGLTSAAAITAPGRLTSAYTRAAKDADLMPLAVDDAIPLAAQRLRAIIDKHGPDAVAFYVSGQMSLEAQYVTNKLAKGFIGTNNIDANSRLCMSSAASGYKQSLGADGPPGSYQDIEHSHAFLVVGSNMADCHPILFLRLLERRKQAGAKLIVVDPRRTATAEKADLYLRIKSGTDLALLNGLLFLLREHGQIDEHFIATHTEGWDALSSLLDAYTPAVVSELTGITEADIRQAARWLGKAPEWMSFWTMGLNQSTHGVWHTNALCNLHLATGKICRPGSGPFSLTGQPNAMGGREVGYLSHGLPGQRTVVEENDRHQIEDLWGIPRGTIRTQSGLDALSLFRKLADGTVKAVWIICTNPVASLPNRSEAIAGLQKAELVISQDVFFDTETNRYADILLPGALWAEAEGVMVNSERTLTLTEQAVEPPGQALADWRIVAQVAQAMGYEHAFAYESAADVFEEIRQTWNSTTGYDMRGVSYERLRQEPMQWPCPPAAAARNPMRYRLPTPQEGEHQLRFPTPSRKARFLARPYLPPAETPDAAYPMILNTGRLPHQWHTLTKTGKIPTLNKLNPRPFVELHPHDAEALGIVAEDRVRVQSRRGQAAYPAVLTDRVQPGSCFVPFHWTDLFGPNLAVNAVTNDAVDATSLQPEYKYCAVRLEKMPMEGIAVKAPISFAVPSSFNEEQLAQIGVGLGQDTAAPVMVLYASQTGNAEQLAQRLGERLHDANVYATVLGMDAYPAAKLTQETLVIIVTSTYGDGDAPDNARAFLAFLQSSVAPRLPRLRYAVLALGDSVFAQFCQCGKNFDLRLAELGAQRLLPRVECDVDFHASAETWMGQVLVTLASSARNQSEENVQLRATSTHIPVREVRTCGYDKSRPFPARLLTNRVLNAPGSSKETRHYELQLEGSGLQYEAGDTLGIWPTNCPALVAEILQQQKLDGEALVTLHGVGELSLRDALLKHRELTCASRELIHTILVRSRTSADVHADTRADAIEYMLKGRQLVDVLHTYPQARLSAEELISLLQPLRPRPYSISSSPKAHTGQVHLTVRTLRYACSGRMRKGVSSTFLADRVGDGTVPMFVRPSPHFHLPADASAPVLMIGPGTGIAPFRGFLHERQAAGAHGRNWLFFGEQRATTDFYYQDELLTLQRDGVLTHLDVAFSRDRPEKTYVQHLLMAHGARVWAWLQDGTYLYVCGDAQHMAKDVDHTLQMIATQHGGLSEDAARTYFQQLSSAKRYRRDVY